MSFELRPYQTAAVTATLDDLAGGAKSMLSILPTGSGKTEVFIRICQEWTAEHPQQSVLLLSHLSLLTDQTKERFKLRARECEASILQAHRRPTVTSRVVISTMQTAREKEHQEWLGRMMIRQVGLIIVDEAHMIPTPSYEAIRATYPTAPLVGFTATPFHCRQLMTSCFDKLSYSISMQELIDQGYLVPPMLHQILHRNSALEDTIALVLSIYRDREAGSQAIVYMQSIQDATLMATAFVEIGIPSIAITQELTGAYRRQVLDSFNRGETKVLTTVNVLTAGFDSPAVETIIMPYGTDSPTTYIQRVGRGLRPNPSRNKTCCNVYIFGDAPAIARHAYERLHQRVLTADGTPKTYDTYTDDFKFNDHDETSEVFLWTETVVKAIERMEKLGMDHFAAMLNSKAFPTKFMTNIASLLSALPKRPCSLPNGQKSISENQKAFLFKQGFGSAQISGLTKQEASLMIGAIVNSTAPATPSQPKWTVPEGKYAGRHISETPFSYRSIVKKRFPDSPVAALIRQWEQEKKQ